MQGEYGKREQWDLNSVYAWAKKESFNYLNAITCALILQGNTKHVSKN